MPFTAGAFEDDVGLDLDGAQYGRRIGGKERVAGAGGEDHGAFFSPGAATALRLMNGSAMRSISMGRLQAGFKAFFFQCTLEGQSVDDGGQHPHVVALNPIHALGSSLHAPEDVAPADDQAYLDAFLGDALDVLGILREALGVLCRNFVRPSGLLR